jgi:NADH-quinone oxidoreductase subunit D
MIQDCELNYDGDMIESVQFARGREVRPLWQKIERLKPNEMIFWVDRLDSLCSIPSEWALAQAMESASDYVVSKRSLFVRTILCEVNRLVWLTTYLGRVIGSLGQESLRQQVFVLREQVFTMQEELTGGRILPGAFCIGGTRRELALGDVQKIRLFIQGWKFSWERWLNLVEPDILLKRRLSGLLPISPEIVKKFGWWGIVGKASGVAYDARKHRPHGAYPFIDFNIIGRTSGDALALFEIAMGETSLSLDLIDRLLTLIPGQLDAKKDRAPFNPGVFFGTSESAKGPVTAIVETNRQDHVLNVKLFTCGQRVWPRLENFIKGIRIEDFEVAVASLGIDPEEAEA